MIIIVTFFLEIMFVQTGVVNSLVMLPKILTILLRIVVNSWKVPLYEMLLLP